MKSKGFTLVEMLVVVSIVGILLSVSLPVSYSMYQRYQASLKAEEVLLFLSSARRDAFLYSEEKSLRSRGGRLLVNEVEAKGLTDIFLQIDTPIKFFGNGTTSGGEVKVYVDNNTFLIGIEPPLGSLSLMRSS